MQAGALSPSRDRASARRAHASQATAVAHCHEVSLFSQVRGSTQQKRPAAREAARGAGASRRMAEVWSQVREHGSVRSVRDGESTRGARGFDSRLPFKTREILTDRRRKPFSLWRVHCQRLVDLSLATIAFFHPPVGALCHCGRSAGGSVRGPQQPREIKGRPH